MQKRLLPPVAICLVALAQTVCTAAEVTIIRDTWGIPHIFADSDEAAMYGLGYAAAEDRAFGMYFNLRIMQGRLAELVGDAPRLRRKETAVWHDRWMRTNGFYRAAETAARNLDEPTRRLLEAYAAGVNDYIAEHREKLHPLFATLGLEPEPWSPAACIVSWWSVAQFFGTDGTRDLLAWRSRQGEADPRRQRGQAAGRIVDDTAAVVQRHHVTDAWLREVHEFIDAHEARTGEPAGTQDGPKFSHAWVVGGERTTTGSAVLVSDPQTPVRNPSLFYEFHVAGETFNARGIGVAGSPLILIGFNEHVAWGATALGADQADLFRLRTDAEHPDEYEVDGAWLPIESRRETIRVKDGEDQTLEIRTTRFGPIINEFAFSRPGDPLVALKRVPLCETDRDTVEGALAMMRAQNVRAFHRALEGWRFPSANFVFGDRDGHIGYSIAGAIPLRSAAGESDGGTAADGSSARFDWQAMTPHRLMPHVINPPEGVLFSGNHRPVASFYPAALGLSTGSAGDTVRSWRLRERLAEKRTFTPEDVLAIHHDATNPARRDVVKLALHLRDRAKLPLSSDAVQALKHLEPWLERGARSDLNIPGAALAMKMNLFFRIVATDLALEFGGGETGLTHFLKKTIAQIERVPGAPLSDDARLFVDQTLAGAWQAAREAYGDDPAEWESRATDALAAQSLGYYETLHGFGSLDPGMDVPMPPLSHPDGGTITCQTAQSYTQFVPLHDVDQAMSILPPGTSELPGAPSRFATRKLWSEGKLHPAPLSRPAVERIKASQTMRQWAPQ